MLKYIWVLFALGSFFNEVGAQEKPNFFPYGIASGDPLAHQVMIWTKVVPEAKTKWLKVQWELSSDPNMEKVEQSGTFKARSETDYSVKIDLQNLESGQYYYYQFEYQGQKSPIGRTKTAAQGKVERLRFAVVSCSNYQAGYFNAYGNIAKREDLDALIHLGDYIYEYPEGGYGDSSLMASGARSIQPKTELLKLSDYRQRYATYRLDPNLQRLHQMHPFIMVWDDHETANDAYKEGAQNHQEGEGAWEDRKAAARQAYEEWMPIRGDLEPIYRKFQFGDLAELIMLDTRLEGRDKQIKDVRSPELYAADRSILGKKQKTWLLNALENSPSQWKILGNQVMFSEYNVGWAAAASPEYTPEQIESIFLDIWDGYPAERAEIIQFLTEKKIDDVVIVTGDVHCSFAYDVALRPSQYAAGDQKSNYDPTSGKGSVAVEFVTPGITSANYDENIGSSQAKILEFQMNKPLPNNINPNPHMKYVDLTRHGYMILDINAERAQAEWYFSTDILKDQNGEVPGESWFTRTKSNHLEKAEK